MKSLLYVALWRTLGIAMPTAEQLQQRAAQAQKFESGQQPLSVAFGKQCAL